MMNRPLSFSQDLAFAVVAAGKGQRAGEGLPKVYRSLMGRPVLRQALEALKSACPHADIFVAISPDHEELFYKASQGLDVHIVYGGATRMLSVKACLEAMYKSSPRYVMVHDAARPFVTSQMIKRLLGPLQDENYPRYDGALPFLPVSDALKKTKDGRITEEVSREGLIRVQTPQLFRFKALWQAFENRTCGDDVDDEAQLARSADLSIALVPGEESNKKLTWPEDFLDLQTPVSLPNSVINSEPEQQKVPLTTTGFGYDVHRLAKGAGLSLCGVWIPCPYSLVGHSDADVGLHALTDALLGACGEGDLGEHFPPGDPRWKNVPSERFLRHAHNLVYQKGAEPVHLDLTLIAETPKIKPYREAMRSFIAEALKLPLSRVSIKATTTEGLGFPGRKEGIAAYAVVSLHWPAGQSS